MGVVGEGLVGCLIVVILYFYSLFSPLCDRAVFRHQLPMYTLDYTIESTHEKAYVIECIDHTDEWKESLRIGLGERYCT